MEPRRTKNSRRRFLGLLAAGSGSGLGASVAQGCGRRAPEQPLTEKDQLDIGNRGPELVERASSLARDYTPQFHNCAQATIAALQDAIEFVPRSDAIFLAGSCLHGGATATGNANCGGFTGSGIVIGHLCGRTREKASDREAQKLSSALIRQVAAKFEETYGSVICKDVRAKSEKRCGEVVAKAAGWAAEAILDQFTKRSQG
jgi:C_GCAxxG_C_C family probable redox protein